jgi:hypothetical protein
MITCVTISRFCVTTSKSTLHLLRRTEGRNKGSTMDWYLWTLFDFDRQPLPTTQAQRIPFPS